MTNLDDIRDQIEYEKEQEPMSYWTVVVRGNHVTDAKDQGYHAYYAGGYTAIETGKGTKSRALSIGRAFGSIVNCFE